MFVNADDVNRWISLGSFDVARPFGVESLQIIAKNHQIVKLPRTHYDANSGYYVLGKEIKKVLTATRGLIRKKTKKEEVSEAVLTFTTME